MAAPWSSLIARPRPAAIPDSLAITAAPSRRLRPWAPWLRAQWADQAERWPLWTPVALGGGAALYFALPREPLPVVGVALGAAGLLLLAAARLVSARWAVAVLTLVACMALGLSAAKLRAERVATPIAAAQAEPALVQAWVVDVDTPGQGGQRLLLAPVRIDGWRPSQTPRRIRVTLRESAPPAPGSAIALLAKLGPPPPPAAPGGYDFARDAYFESIGGVGFALGAPRPWAAETPPPWRLRLTMAVNALRWGMAERIVSILGAERGGLAAAMTSGVEAFVPQQQVDDLRAAGLAHIISISGIHMAIVGGFAFAAVRVGIAAWPWLALRAPGKKIAAVAGLAAVGGYLILSGASPPAERAAITASLAFLAMLVDRQAISLRALAVAALVVLLLQPEAVTEPGFQMSFAATAALVALAEAWPRPVREINTPWAIRAIQGARTWIVAGAAISLVAGLATGPFAIQHFNRVATWGLVANLMVEPISSLIIMPALAIGALLTPFGLGGPPLALAGFGIGLMTRIASSAAQAPLAQMTIASAPSWLLPVAFLGLLWVCLMRGPLRWLGVPFALAISLVPRPAAPVAWAAADGAAVAVRDGASAILLRPDVKLFGAELWARRRGLEPAGEGQAARDAHFACDSWSCGPGPGAPVRLAATWNVKRPLAPGRLAALCDQAEILLLRAGTPPPNCRARLVLTAQDFARGGAAEIYRAPGGGFEVVWGQAVRGRRPWTWGAGAP